MKNMKKVLAVMTAVSALAASTSAFAADNTVDVSAFTGMTTGDEITGLTATYNLKDNDFDVILGESFAPVNDMTLLILNKDMTTEQEADVQDGDIRYIDQGTAFENAGLKLDENATELAPGSYKVKIGYDDGTGFAIAVATITVTEVADTPTGNTVTLKWGDLNADTYVNATDALLAILAYGDTYTNVEITGSTATANVSVGDKTNSVYAVNNNTIVWGDLNADTYVNATDALLAILAYGDTNSDVTVGDNNVSVGKTKANVDLANKTITFVVE